MAWSQYQRKPSIYRVKLDDVNCVYCGEPSSCVDHFPPKVSTRFGFILPSCRECNHLAGTEHPFNFVARAAHVKKRLRQRYERWLQCPDWADDEIETLGRGLIQGVRVWRLQKEIARERLAWNAENYLRRIDTANDFARMSAKTETMPMSDKG